MRKLLTIILASLLPVFCAFAQDRIGVLDRVPGHRVTFEYAYSLIQDGTEGDTVTSGQVTVQGNAFRLDGLGMEIWSDGTARWTVDRQAKEVLIEPVEGSDPLTNPALFVLNYRSWPGMLKVRSQSDSALDVEVHLDDGMVAHLRLKDIVFGEEGALSDFVFHPEDLGSGCVVTDLR